MNEHAFVFKRLFVRFRQAKSPEIVVYHTYFDPFLSLTYKQTAKLIADIVVFDDKKLDMYMLLCIFYIAENLVERLLARGENIEACILVYCRIAAFNQ